LVGVEGFGIPAPGQTILEAGAVAAAAPDARLRIGWLLLAAFLAAALGNTLGYWLGRAGGRPLLRRLRISERHLGRVEAGFGPLRRLADRLRPLLRRTPSAQWNCRRHSGNALGALHRLQSDGRCPVGLLLGPRVYYIDLHLDGLVALIRRINPWMAAATVAVLGHWRSCIGSSA